MKRTLIIYLAILIPFYSLISQKTEIQYLSGTGYKNTVDWEFFCTKGRESGKWATIPVPSCWELEGFGGYNYGHDLVPTKKDGTYGVHDEQGRYKYEFKIPSSWAEKQINIVFEGSMTDTKVKINGKQAGPVHQGSFYRFKYDVTKLLKPGKKNLLEVEVSKISENHSVNIAERKADYWVFGGIFRPVYLEAKPAENIEHFAVDAKANGNFLANVYLQNIKNTDHLEAKIYNEKGLPLTKTYQPIEKKQEKTTLTGRISHPKKWTPETPHLYKLKIGLYAGENLVHEVTEKIGFRTVEIHKNDGIYVNNKKIVMKGVNRHSFHPESGRTTNKKMSIEDVELMKAMNMNAVRMSHYPPDKHFLDVCDSLGLFVLDELAGWQWPPYDTEVGKKLVKEMVMRDVNHPCIILWDNGNEGGWNTDLDKEFAKYDPQNRHVIHPWAIFNGIDAQHYKPYGYGANSFFNGDDIFFPTEILHGLYDGGHGAGLEDYWRLMMDNPLSAGGFLWVFTDEGVVRTDKNNIIDCDGNHAPDGILGPYREKEGSFNAIKEIWSPVYINKDIITAEFNGYLEVENRYLYTNLNLCDFEWKLVNFPKFDEPETGYKVEKSGKANVPSIPPSWKGIINLELPGKWQNHDALLLTATNTHGKKVYTWSWNIKNPSEYADEIPIENGEGKFVVDEDDKLLTVEINSLKVTFDKNSGKLTKVVKNNEAIPFNNGPSISFQESEFQSFTHKKTGNSYLVEAIYKKGIEKITWKIMKSGWIKLHCAYRPDQEHYDYLGVNFNFPEDQVKSVRYLGNGPYRVWKNRLKGVELNVWKKEYNNTITGSSWDYPEFKGYYSNFHWAEFNTKTQPFKVVSFSNGLYLRLFTPIFQEDARNAQAAFPKGNISFMHGINPIGTKFHKASDLGPMSEKNKYYGWKKTTKPLECILLFYFGKIK